MKVHWRIRLPITWVLGILALAWIPFLSSCTTHGPGKTRLVSTKASDTTLEETFDFRRWQKKNTSPSTVIIGIHGFCGAAIDYENLGKYLVRHQPDCAVYAYEVRGQGRDPKKERRGDIDNPDLWFRDLNEFTRLVRLRHPKARILWFGESMGSLIATHTYVKTLAETGKSPCDGLILSSPVVRFLPDFPSWKKSLVIEIARLAPTARVSLDALAGGKDVQMTHDTVHSQQAETNAWHIESHTLRLLVALVSLIDGMPPRASQIEVPVLILHGGRDFFANPADIRAFFGSIPAKAGKTRRYYPEAYHLLMYDSSRNAVLRDVRRWINQLPPASSLKH